MDFADKRGLLAPRVPFMEYLAGAALALALLVLVLL